MDSRFYQKRCDHADKYFTENWSPNLQVFIIGHVPPGAFERYPDKKWFYPQFNQRYIQLILKHADVIKGHFLAHQHCDSFKLFYDDEGKYQFPITNSFELDSKLK